MEDSHQQEEDDYQTISDQFASDCEDEVDNVVGSVEMPGDQSINSVVDSKTSPDCKRRSKKSRRSPTKKIRKGRPLKLSSKQLDLIEAAVKEYPRILSTKEIRSLLKINASPSAVRHAVVPKKERYSSVLKAAMLFARHYEKQTGQ